MIKFGPNSCSFQDQCQGSDSLSVFIPSLACGILPGKNPLETVLHTTHLTISQTKAHAKRYIQLKLYMMPYNSTLNENLTCRVELGGCIEKYIVLPISMYPYCIESTKSILGFFFYILYRMFLSLSACMSSMKFFLKVQVKSSISLLV
jgi:hypothetical protein